MLILPVYHFSGGLYNIYVPKMFAGRSKSPIVFRHEPDKSCDGMAWKISGS